jgi:hypothetical protein
VAYHALERYDDWLACKNPELAKTFLQRYPAELMHGEPAPKVAQPQQGSLF